MLSVRFLVSAICGFGVLMPINAQAKYTGIARAGRRNLKPILGAACRGF